MINRLLSPTALTLAVGLLAVSCASAPVGWDKPGTTQDRWVKDKVDCQYKARREAERRFRQRSADSPTSGFRDKDTLSSDMARYDAKREERRLFEGCLKDRGYRKMKKTAPTIKYGSRPFPIPSMTG